MRKFVVLSALCAAIMLFATTGSARADHYPHSGGIGTGSGFGGGYGYGGGYGAPGGYGGIRSSPYGPGSGYCPHDSYGAYGGSRYIDPYHGVRLRNQARNRYDFILQSGNFGLYYGR